MRGLARNPDVGFVRTISAVSVADVALAVILRPIFALSAEFPPLRELAIATYLGVCQWGLAFILSSLGLRRVTALEGALRLLIEPVLSPWWVWLVHDEVVGTWTVLGGLLMLLATGARAMATCALKVGPGNLALRGY